MLSQGLFNLSPPCPFDTFPTSRQGIAGLVALLPSLSELTACLHCFRVRLHAYSFPLLSADIATNELEQTFLEATQNRFYRPDTIALLFAMLALNSRQRLLRNYNGRWTAQSLEDDLKKGDDYSECTPGENATLLTQLVSAAVLALRLDSYLKTPTLLNIQALHLICSYLTDSGRLQESWEMFNITVKLAQAMNRKSSHLTLVIGYIGS